MSPFKVVYLCTFISISIFLSLLWVVGRVCSTSRHLCTVWKLFCCCCFVCFPFVLNKYLNVNSKQRCGTQKKKKRNRRPDFSLDTVKGNPGSNRREETRKENKWKVQSVSPSRDYFSDELSNSFSRTLRRATKTSSVSCGLRRVIQPQRTCLRFLSCCCCFFIYISIS